MVLGSSFLSQKRPKLRLLDPETVFPIQILIFLLLHNIVQYRYSYIELGLPVVPYETTIIA